MQDFRNLNNRNITRLPREVVKSRVPNEYGGIYDKPKAPKIVFIKARINKDNFWNIVFFLIAVISVWIAETIARTISFGFVLPFTIPTFAIVLFLLSKLNPVSFDNDLYTSKLGKSVKQGEFCPGATLAFIALWCIIFFGIMSRVFIAKPLSTMVITTLVGAYLFVPIMYCILKNIPISVFYHKKAWGGESYPINTDNSYEPKKDRYTSMVTSPSRACSPGNIYYHKP